MNRQFKAAQFCHRRMSDRTQGRGSECLGVGPSFFRCCVDVQTELKLTVVLVIHTLLHTLPPRRYTLVSFVALLISLF